ncbi:MAG: hypothetical protein IPK91_02680 [Saprospiraceae bacterium]|nr:hypothetical protein [Saprospiraceae bacterium]MBK8296195.1 hypothetical protein [Saprospiraceae bacterium]
MKAALRNIEDVREWFMQMKMPYWSLWNGFSKETKERAGYNEEEGDLEASWDILEQFLRRKQASGGRMTIFVAPKFGSPNGATEYLDLPVRSQQAAMAGIHGGDPYSIAGKPIEVHIAEQVDAKISALEKDRKIADLEAQLAAKQEGTGLEKLWNRITDELPVEQIILGLIGRFVNTNTPQTAINGTPNKMEDMQELTPEQADSINESLSRIQNVIGDLTVNLEKLATWIEKNPDMAKSLLKSL